MQRDNTSPLVERIERGICGGLSEKSEGLWWEDLFEERAAPVYPHTPVGTTPTTYDTGVALKDGELDADMFEGMSEKEARRSSPNNEDVRFGRAHGGWSAKEYWPDMVYMVQVLDLTSRGSVRGRQPIVAPPPPS